MKISLTGIKPTGNIHIGNYFGAIKPAIALTEQYFGVYFVADLHALNSNFLQKNCSDKSTKWQPGSPLGLTPRKRSSSVSRTSINSRADHHPFRCHPERSDESRPRLQSHARQERRSGQ